MATRLRTASSKRREGLWSELPRVAGGHHQESAFALAVQEYEAVRGVAFGAPAVLLQAFDGGGHGVVEIGVGLQLRAFDDLPLQSPEHDVAWRCCVCVRIGSLAAHAADCGERARGSLFSSRRVVILYRLRFNSNQLRLRTLACDDFRVGWIGQTRQRVKQPAFSAAPLRVAVSRPYSRIQADCGLLSRRE
jgi:hypothetical protein